MFQKINLNQILILWALVIYGSLLIGTTLKPFGEQHFAYLAHSFLQGRVDMNDYSWARSDNSYFRGNYYWPLGPFPAILLTPLVFISKGFGYLILQKDVQWIFVLFVFYLIYKISGKLGYDHKSCILLSFAFSVGSVFLYVSIVPFSWYFAQVVSVLLTFTAFYEFLGKRRYWLIGTLIGALFLTRATAILGILFYFSAIVFLERSTTKTKFRNILLLGLPVVGGIVILAFYNYIRFGNVFEQGYSYQLLGEELVKARSYGIFGLIHLPGNLYYLFLSSPLPVLKDGLSRVLAFPFIKYDYWGMGIFYTSPYLLTLFLFKYKDFLSKTLLLISLLISVPIVMYYGIGAIQYGYRYSLDFLPYLFLIFLLNLKNRKISGKIGLLIILSIVFNLYMVFTRKYSL